MEIGEIISTPQGHDSPDNECPFCPPADENEKFKTYPGAKKSEDKLKKIMANPSDLTSQEGGTRPKEGQNKQQQPSSAKPLPESPLVHETYGSYTYEAHHLIPGKEKIANKSTKAVMMGHSIEKWIVTGSTIEKDSGYSINNSDNGVWLPSVPTLHKKGPGPKPDQPWASPAKTKKNPDALTEKQKVEIAEYAMNNGEGQFHYGPHKVSDDDGAHYTYPNEVSGRLSDLEVLVAEWSEVCLCDGGKIPPEPPFKPSWKIHEKLDLISMWIQIEIQLMPPASWTYFISALAKDLAKKKSGNTQL